MTSRSVNLRRLSKIKLTYRIVTIVVIVWFLHAIPCPIFYNISPVTNKCVITNTVYNRIYISAWSSLYHSNHRHVSIRIFNLF
jgi:hypothetical protein